ncbi:hypothetical protein [Salmonella enterica]|uniref:hypothetical protein n=1 Tax=Salmonella enterica TaxID=28901 RepID=UPI00398C47C3
MYYGYSINPLANSTRQCETTTLRVRYRRHPLIAGGHIHKYFGHRASSYDPPPLLGRELTVHDAGPVLVGFTGVA